MSTLHTWLRTIAPAQADRLTHALGTLTPWPAHGPATERVEPGVAATEFSLRLRDGVVASGRLAHTLDADVLKVADLRAALLSVDPDIQEDCLSPVLQAIAANPLLDVLVGFADDKLGSPRTKIYLLQPGTQALSGFVQLAQALGQRLQIPAALTSKSIATMGQAPGFLAVDLRPHALATLKLYFLFRDTDTCRTALGRCGQPELVAQLDALPADICAHPVGAYVLSVRLGGETWLDTTLHAHIGHSQTPAAHILPPALASALRDVEQKAQETLGLTAHTTYVSFLSGPSIATSVYYVLGTAS
jgi:hypothetical protein